MTDRTIVASANSPALWILAILATLAFLRSAQALLIPIALAVLVSYALEPVVAWLERHHVTRWLGAALVLLAVLALCVAGALGLRDDAAQLADLVPRALQRARAIVLSQLGDGAADIPEATSAEMTGSLLQHAASTAFAAAWQAVVVSFLIYFLLVSSGHVRHRLIEILGGDAQRRRTASTIIDDIDRQIQRYPLVLLITAAIVGVATWAVLAWMHVQDAAMWGILAGVFNSIPYFGPVIVSGGLLMVGIAQGGGLTNALQMAGAAIVITSFEGWLLTPPLMGKAERMNALAVFVGLMLWTWIWGEWGTVLAVPMLVVIKSIADHVDFARPLGRLLAP